MDPSATTSSTAIISLKVSAIKGNGFPDVGWPKRAGKYYVTITVREESKQTAVSARSNAPAWNEMFTFNAPETSLLKVQVFAKRNVGQDDFIGGMEESIQSLLTPRGGRVISRALSDKDSKPVLRSTPAVVEFILLELKGGPAKNEFGIHVLVPGVNPVVDIVAIHGLDGHIEQSWTADNGILWLRDLLPEQVPQARILTYGYDAYTRGRDQLADESVHDLAKDLVSSLATERRISDTERRPIIFVAHSLGGIVLKSVS